jgi:hypothetical protein
MALQNFSAFVTITFLFGVSELILPPEVATPVIRISVPFLSSHSTPRAAYFNEFLANVPKKKNWNLVP